MDGELMHDVLMLAFVIGACVGAAVILVALRVYVILHRASCTVGGCHCR